MTDVMQGLVNGRGWHASAKGKVSVSAGRKGRERAGRWGRYFSESGSLIETMVHGT